jgi:hypothetical protein
VIRRRRRTVASGTHGVAGAAPSSAAPASRSITVLTNRSSSALRCEVKCSLMPRRWTGAAERSTEAPLEVTPTKAPRRSDSHVRRTTSSAASIRSIRRVSPLLDSSTDRASSCMRSSPPEPSTCSRTSYQVSGRSRSVSSSRSSFALIAAWARRNAAQAASRSSRHGPGSAMARAARSSPPAVWSRCSGVMRPPYPEVVDSTTKLRKYGTSCFSNSPQRNQRHAVRSAAPTGMAPEEDL